MTPAAQPWTRHGIHTKVRQQRPGCRGGSLEAAARAAEGAASTNSRPCQPSHPTPPRPSRPALPAPWTHQQPHCCGHKGRGHQLREEVHPGALPCKYRCCDARKLARVVAPVIPCRRGGRGELHELCLVFKAECYSTQVIQVAHSHGACTCFHIECCEPVQYAAALRPRPPTYGHAVPPQGVRLLLLEVPRQALRTGFHSGGQNSKFSQLPGNFALPNAEA